MRIRKLFGTNNIIKMKKILFAVIFGCGLASGQVAKIGKFNFSSGLGFSEYQVKNIYKVNAFNHFINLGKDFRVGHSSFVVLGLGYRDYFYDYNQYHIKSSFIEVPIGLNLRLSREESNFFYTGIGVNNKYKINEKVENFQDGEVLKEEKGYHLGSYAEFGYSAKVSEKLHFFIGVNYYSDLLQSGYKNDNKVTNQANLVLGINVF